MASPLSVPDHDLFGEFSRAVGDLNDQHFEWFREHGVSDETIFGGPSLCGADRALIEGNRYQAHPDGIPAVIVAVGLSDHDGWHRIDDLVAYSAADPHRSAVRHGNEAILGRLRVV